MVYQHGRLLLCTDEKTGMQILGRPFPTQPPEPGKRLSRKGNNWGPSDVEGG